MKPLKIKFINIQLSIVIPVFNEAGVLKELAERCLKAGGKTGLEYEIIIVDDGSDDDTGRIISEMAGDDKLKFIRLEKNAGQFNAIKKGFAAVRGEMVVALDGDLQDPPEKIPEVVTALLSGGEETQVVFAVKSSRREPLWAMAGQTVFHFLQSTLARVDFPSGAGTFCAMRRDVAQQVSHSSITRANLPSVLAMMKLPYSVIRYDRAERYDSRSRIGFCGLFREAIASMALTGALNRLGLLTGLFLFLCWALVLIFDIPLNGLVFIILFLTAFIVFSRCLPVW